MPCNGWNHAASCECGWGGQWHGSYGGRKPTPAWEAEQIQYRDYFFKYWSHGRLGDFASYTNPNARCPVCNDRVYFYQSPHGGRVFFDELGPPWPKHSCTDNSLPAYGQPRCKDYPKPDPSYSSSGNHKPLWVNDGWDPVIFVSLSQVEDMTVLVVERIENDDRITLGIDKTISIDKHAPIHLQEHGDELGVFDLSYLQLHAGNVSAVHDTWYRNARKSPDVRDWKEALLGAVHCQNAVAGTLLFGNVEPEAPTIDLTATRIDFDAVYFWLNKATKGGSGVAAKNIATIQKKRLDARFSGNTALSKADFQV